MASGSVKSKGIELMGRLFFKVRDSEFAFASFDPLRYNLKRFLGCSVLELMDLS